MEDLAGQAPLPSADDELKLEEFKKDCELRGMSHGSVLSYIYIDPDLHAVP